MPEREGVVMDKSLEHSFLRFIGVDSDGQMKSQRYYEQFFKDCKDIVDLGCGDGDFVKLMCERGYRALGVDQDQVMCEKVKDKGIPIVCDDAFDYLRNASEESVDGFFSSHLVEHLYYEQVLELIELCYRVLRPGGVLVLTTPNVRGLYSHLEMFWLHFGHKNFYHPRLLEFFLTYVGYEEIESGESPGIPSPLLQDFRPLIQNLALVTRSRDSGGTLPSGPPRDLILTGASWWRKLFFKIKLYLAKSIALPYVDWTIAEFNQALTTVAQTQCETMQILLELDRPFECYAVGRKPA
jgi:SAM-dependent methyltransferase